MAHPRYPGLPRVSRVDACRALLKTKDYEHLKGWWCSACGTSGYQFFAPGRGNFCLACATVRRGVGVALDRTLSRFYAWRFTRRFRGPSQYIVYLAMGACQCSNDALWELQESAEETFNQRAFAASVAYRRQASQLAIIDRVILPEEAADWAAYLDWLAEHDGELPPWGLPLGRFNECCRMDSLAFLELHD